MNNQPNPNIRCSVDTCRYHTNEQCCSLGSIKVGNTNKNAEHAAATECNSFEFAGELHPSRDEIQRLKQQKQGSSMDGRVGSSLDGSLYEGNSMDAKRSPEDF